MTAEICRYLSQPALFLLFTIAAVAYGAVLSYLIVSAFTSEVAR